MSEMVESHATLDSLLEDLDACTGLDGMRQVVRGFRDVFSVRHMAYHWLDSAGLQFGCDTYSDLWRARYQDHSYLRTDPVVSGCYQRFRPVDWKRLDWTSKAARVFLLDAQEHGLGHQGFSVPIRGPNGQFALFTANDGCDDDTWARFCAANSRDLILVAHFLHRKALDIQPDRQPEPAQSLSPREVDAMTLLAMGHSRAQVAQALSISEHTLRVYIEGARLKLGALNTTHAVARALSCGLIVV